MICPSCSTQCDDTSTFCQTCGRRVAGGKTPWLLLGCPMTLLLFVAAAAVLALIFKQF